MTAALETEGRDKALDFGTGNQKCLETRDQMKDNSKYARLSVGLRVLLLGALDLSPHDVLADIVLLREVEELADLSRTLGTKALGEDIVRKARDVVLTLLDNHEGKNSDVGADDAAADGLALALTLAAGAVAAVALAEEEAHTVGEKDTLLHGEALLVVTASDAEDVALELVAEGVAGDFLGHFLVVEDAANNRSGRSKWRMV